MCGAHGDNPVEAEWNLNEKLQVLWRWANGTSPTFEHCRIPESLQITPFLWPENSDVIL
jgi:hypothetical protein